MAAKKRPGLWVRVHDRIWQDDRVLDLAMRGDRGVAAVGVFVMSVAWSHHARTDGELPRGCLALIHGRKQHADALVEVGLWEATKTGWRIPRYEDWQDTSAEIDANVAAKSAAGRKSACLRYHVQPCRERDCPTGRNNVFTIGQEGRNA